MGNVQTQIHPTYVGIYTKILQIQSVHKRTEMIQTLFSAPEYVNIAKQTGIYGSLIQYVSRVQNGQTPGLLPGEETHTQQNHTQKIQPNQIQGQVQQRRQPQLQQQGHRQSQNQNTMITNYQEQPTADPYEQLSTTPNNDRALNYFQICLQVMGLEEEVALTEETLKSAYKKAALKAHPDKKGGSEKAFEQVTRAYAYLSEIIRRIQGGRSKATSMADANPNQLRDSRFKESDDFQHTKPIKFNPDKLDLNAFNKMFEQTRIPDPDDDGYGDWLNDSAQNSQDKKPVFGGKYNRDVFNKMFEDDSKQKNKHSSALSILSPQSLMLAPSMGVELGRDRPDNYTAAANASLKFTDLKDAYTTESTFSGQVSDVRVDARSYEDYTNSRKGAPAPLKNEELQAIAYAEKMAEEKERKRSLRAANEGIVAQDYFERMKQLVLTDAKPIGTGNRR